MTYRINGKALTKEEWDALPQRGITAGKPPMVQSMTPFVSPVDGSVISSKQQLRQHEIEHNVTQVGDEYVGVVEEKKKERDQLKADMKHKVREAEKNGIEPNFNWQ